MTEDKFWEEMEEFYSHTGKLKLFPPSYNIDNLDEFELSGFTVDEPVIKKKPIVKEIDLKKSKNENSLF